MDAGTPGSREQVPTKTEMLQEGNVPLCHPLGIHYYKSTLKHLVGGQGPYSDQEGRGATWEKSQRHDGTSLIWEQGDSVGENNARLLSPYCTPSQNQ